MNTSNERIWRRVPIHVALAVAALTSAGGAHAGAAIDNDDRPVAAREAKTDDPRVSPATPIEIQTSERQRMRKIVAAMPSYWPATEVMRRAADEPAGDAVDRERWRRSAERMPAGWTATELMLRAADEPAG